MSLFGRLASVAGVVDIQHRNRPRTRRNLANVEPLEDRLLPAYVTLLSWPTGTATGVGDVDTSTETEDQDGFWTQEATIAIPEGSDLGTYETGTYSTSGDLKYKVEAGPDDLAGDLVKVTMRVYYRTQWALDSLNSYKATVGYAEADDVFSLEGGNQSDEIDFGHWVITEDYNTIDIEVQVGETFTLHVVNEAESDPWFDFVYGLPYLQINYGGEIYSRLSVWATEVESLVSELYPLTFDDDIEDEKILGPYLAGANFSPEIEIRSVLIDPTDIKTVKWSLDGVTHTAPESSFSWDINPVVKNLSPGDHTLKFEGFDADGRKIARSAKDIKIRIIDKLDFELEVQPKEGTWINVEDARFFQNIFAELSFRGSIKDLPTYYRDSLHLFFGTVENDFSWGDSTDEVFRFEFDRNVATLKLPSGFNEYKTPVDFRIGETSITQFGDTFENLLSVKTPAWLSGGNPKFNTVTGEYEWKQANLGLMELSAPELPFPKWLDPDTDAKPKKRLTSATLNAYLNVSAPVSTETSPHYEGSKLVGEATLFGKKIWGATYTNSDVKVIGTLDAKTLDPTSFGIKLAQPIQVAQFTLSKG